MIFSRGFSRIELSPIGVSWLSVSKLLHISTLFILLRGVESLCPSGSYSDEADKSCCYVKEVKLQVSSYTSRLHKEACVDKLQIDNI